MTGTDIAAILTALSGIVAVLVKNSRDIYTLKKLACYRYPCEERLGAETSDALQSKSRGL